MCTNPHTVRQIITRRRHRGNGVTIGLDEAEQCLAVLSHEKCRCDRIHKRYRRTQEGDVGKCDGGRGFPRHIDSDDG